jgi:hypothetical protein
MTSPDPLARPRLTGAARLTALFERGKTVKVGEDDEGALFIFVAALNAVEREDALLDGATALARAKLLLVDSETSDLVESELHTSSREEIVGQLALFRSAEAWALSRADLATEEYWRGDRLLLLERGDELIAAGRELSVEESEAWRKIGEEYQVAWQEAATKRMGQIITSYDDKSDREVQDEFLLRWQTRRCEREQQQAYNATMIWHSARWCYATEASGKLNHSECDGHKGRVFPNRIAVKDAPDALIEPILAAALQLENDGGDALGK